MGLSPSDTDRNPPEGPFAPAYRLISLALVALVSIVAFEFMAITTAMPVAAQELGAVRSFGLAFSVMITLQVLGIVLAGAWSDMRGPMPAMYTGQLLFAAGATVCALATSFPVFLLGRAVTGLGAGLIVVAEYVIIGRVYPPALRPRFFTIVSAGWVLPSLVGPPVSAWLTTSVSWRWVFGIVALPALVTWVIMASQADRVRESSASREQPGPNESGTGPNESGTGPRAHAEHVRAAWFAVAVAVTAGLLQLGTRELTSLVSLDGALTGVGIVGVALTAPHLLTPGTMLMRAGLPSVMTARMVLTAAFNGAITFVPLMLVTERHVGLGTAGLLITVGSLGWFLGSWVQGRDRWDDRRGMLVATGALAVAAGVALLAAVAAAGWPWQLMAISLASGGLGMGLSSSSTSVLALELAPVEEHGQASSSLQLADALGSVLGIATGSAIFAALHTVSGADGHVFALLWAVLAVVAGLGVGAGLRSRPVATGPGRGAAVS